MPIDVDNAEKARQEAKIYKERFLAVKLPACSLLEEKLNRLLESTPLDTKASEEARRRSIYVQIARGEAASFSRHSQSIRQAEVEQGGYEHTISKKIYRLRRSKKVGCNVTL